MSNPTTPFSWQMPTATDLVTDLPADFEVFGQAVATSMADLLGGTTGQILAKATNADMDFTWINNDQGDITAVNTAASASTNPLQKAIDAGVISWNGKNPVIPPPVKLNDGGPLMSDIVIEDRA